MFVYLVRRIVNYVILTVIASCLAYVLASLSLNPTAKYLGRNPPVDPHSLQNILNKFGVNPDVPLIERLWHWFSGVLHGDFGLAINSEPISRVIWERAGISLQLLLIGSIIGAVLGVVLGVWGAVRQYKASDSIVTYLSYIVFSTPTFVIAIFLMIAATALNRAIGHQLITFTGQYSAGISGGFFTQFGDRAAHLLLPTIVLVLTSAASYSRYQRNVMLDVLGADYIRTARAKGRTRGAALIRHGVRVALIPMSTFFAYSFGTLVAGASMLEIVFSWHGMGELLLTSINTSDINAVAGSTLFTAVLILCSSTLSEVLYAALDPRVRS